MIVQDFTLPDAYHMRHSDNLNPPTHGSLRVHDERDTELFERTYNLTLNTVGMIRVECATTREGIEHLRDACNAALVRAETEGIAPATETPDTDETAQV